MAACGRAIRKTSILLATGGMGALFAAGCHLPAATSAGNPSPSPSVRSALTAPSPSPAPDAAALWRRTLLAVRAMPLRGTVTDTRFRRDGRVQEQTRFTVIEGGGGGDTPSGAGPHYHLTYVQPQSRAGTVLISDGHSAWRYDPRTKTVIQLAASSLMLPAEMDDGLAGVVVQQEGTTPEIEPDAEHFDGKSVQVLALRRRRSHRISERRWIDVKTGRTLRLEQYGKPDAHLLRRVEMTGTQPGETTADSVAFRPEFPPDATLIDRRGRRTRWQAEAERAAKHAHLPLHVRGYSLRAVDHDAALRGAALPMLSAAKSPGKKETTHLLYTSGDQNSDQAISVFVTTAQQAGKSVAVVLQPGSDWKTAALGPRLRAYTQEMEGGSAVAWADTEHGSYYITLARMPLANLLPVAEAFAANRDDAPGNPVAPPEKK